MKTLKTYLMTALMALTATTMFTSCEDELIADTLEGRTLMLKILSENPFDMEKNCRKECLEVYQDSYTGVLEAFVEVLDKFCSRMTAADKQEFIYAFFPFLHGIYPYTEQRQQQKEAMKAAGISKVIMLVQTGYRLIFL